MLQHSYQLEVGRKITPTGNLGQRAYKSSQISRILGRDFPNFHSLVVTCWQLGKRDATRCNTMRYIHDENDNDDDNAGTAKNDNQPRINTRHQIYELNCGLCCWMLERISIPGTTQVHRCDYRIMASNQMQHNCTFL